VVDIEDAVELEDASRLRGFTRGCSELPEEQARGDVDEWKGGGDRLRIKSVSSIL